MTDAQLHALGCKLTEDQFDLLHHQVDKTRLTSTTVSTNREALVNLLGDYSILLSKIGRM